MFCSTTASLYPVTVSQAEKGANLKDVQDFMVTVPTLEYHNCNWTWTDMLMEVKKVYKQHIIQKVCRLIDAILIAQDQKLSYIGIPCCMEVINLTVTSCTSYLAISVVMF